jgi:hypothetical protein
MPQITLITDPFANANVWGNPEVERFCFNASEWVVQNQAFKDVAIQLGYFCLAAGWIIGALTVYFMLKRKYGSSK